MFAEQKRIAYFCDKMLIQQNISSLNVSVD